MLRVSIEQCQRDDERRLEQFGLLRVLIRQWADGQSQLAAARARAFSLEKEAAALKANVDNLVRRTSDLQMKHKEAQQIRERRAERHQIITRALRDQEDLISLEQEFTDSDGEVKEADRRLEEAEVELRRRQEDLAANDRLLLARDRLRQQLEEAQRVDKAVLEIETLQKRIAVEEGRRSFFLEGLRGIESRAAVLADEARLRAEAVTAATHELEVLEQASATFQQALLVIAEHLRHEDTVCPVCRTSFDPGQLRSFARESISILDPHLANAEIRASAVREEFEELRKREGQITQERRKIEADLRAVNESSGQLQSRIDDLSKHPLLVGLGLQEARALLARMRAEQNADLQRVELELTSGQSAERLRQAVLEAAAAADAQRRARALANELRNTRQVRLAEVLARVSHLEAEHGELGISSESLKGLIEAAALDASKAQEVMDVASVNAAEAQAAEAAVRQTLVVVEAELAKSKAQIDGFISALKVLEMQWRDAEISDQVSESALDAQIEKLGHRKRALSATIGELQLLPGRWSGGIRPPTCNSWSRRSGKIAVHLNVMKILGILKWVLSVHVKPSLWPSALVMPQIISPTHLGE